MADWKTAVKITKLPRSGLVQYGLIAPWARKRAENGSLVRALFHAKFEVPPARTGVSRASFGPSRRSFRHRRHRRRLVSTRCQIPVSYTHLRAHETGRTLV